MTFDQAYTLYGPDVERIAAETGMKPHEVDRLINAEMNRRYRENYLKRWRDENPEKVKAAREKHNARIRENLREIRQRHSA